MNTNYLLSNRYKKWGWILIVSAIIPFLTGLLITPADGYNATVFAVFGSDLQTNSGWFNLVRCNIDYTLSCALFILGTLLVAFSKEKSEDEYLAQLRLLAFQWAVLANYALLLMLFLTVYGIDFVYILCGNVFTVIALFILRFHYLLFINRPVTSHAK